MNTKPLSALLLALALLAAACGSSDATVDAEPTSDASTEEMSDDMTDGEMSDDMADDDMAEDDMAEDDMTDDDMHEDMDDDMTEEDMDEESMSDDDMSDDMTASALLSLELVDVDGETFTLGDYAGTPVFVENFATWCGNCRQQLGDTNTAAGELGDDAAFLALSVETDLSADDVAGYAADNGFDNIRFAVMTPEFLAAMVEAFGNSSINPPSTPHFFLDAMGHPGELVTGFESVEEITAAVPSA